MAAIPFYYYHRITIVTKTKKNRRIDGTDL